MSNFEVYGEIANVLRIGLLWSILKVAADLGAV